MIQAKIKSVLLDAAALLLAVAVRLISLVVPVRFGSLITSRIGHFAVDVELYLCELSKGLLPNGKNIFYHADSPCNNYLYGIVKQRIRIIPFASRIHGMIKRIFKDDRNDLFIRSKDQHGSRDVDCLLQSTSPCLSIDAADDLRGRENLRGYGVADATPYVCIIGRDPQYLIEVNPSIDFSYHDYRNMDINNYCATALHLAAHGYHTFRMGHIVGQKFNCPHQSVHDYATNGMRSEFMDIYLPAHAAFFIGPPSGSIMVAQIFRVPTLFINFIPLDYLPGWNHKDIFIPKLLWIISEKRFMTFREVLSSGAGRWLYTSLYKRNGIEPVENTSEDILMAAKEMRQRIENGWSQSEEDEELQRRFRALFKPNSLNERFNCRIGASFLNRHADLLD